MEAAKKIDLIPGAGDVPPCVRKLAGGRPPKDDKLMVEAIGSRSIYTLVPGGLVGAAVQQSRRPRLWPRPLDGYNLRQGACAWSQSGRGSEGTMTT